jgi:hypothetical protein
VAFAALPAGLSTLLTVASIGVGIAGVVASTSAQMQANDYQRMVAERAAATNEENAQRTINAAQAAQQDQDRQTRALIGQQIATQSASGLKLGGRSQMLTRKTARELGRLDALNIRQAAEVDAYNFRVAGADAMAESQFMRTANSNALLSGFLDAASVGLTGVQNLSKSGLFKTKTSLSAGSRALTGSLRFAR